MRSLLRSWCPPWFAAVLFSTTSGACIDAPPEPGAAIARLVAAWDPLACDEPHRVVVELADEDGVPISASTPCNLGGLTLDVPHLGLYRGRIYAWALAAPIRSVTEVTVTIDEAIVHWQVSTPR